jgi:hypothetical protein
VYNKQEQEKVEKTNIEEQCVDGYTFKKGRFSEEQW